MNADQEWHARIGCWCEPIQDDNACPDCGETINLGELHLPDYTMLCYVCETRFPVKNPLEEK